MEVGSGSAVAESKLVERLVSLTGRAVAWLTLVMVLLTFTIVILRYGFSLGWIWLQESVSYMHAMVFMLAAAWTLQDDGHVRVDIFYRGASPRRKAIVNLAGTILFLIPLCVFLLFTAWEYVWSSWQLFEKSREPGGLPLVYLLKSLILLMPVLLLVQGISNAMTAFKTLRETHRNTA
jgi:TRAP-type mannitol/chloroaromatic compound transport system permease small subunit